MGWLSDLFGVGPEPTPAPQAAPAEPAHRDTPEQLAKANRDLIREINSSAGVLPAVGVVLARLITDDVDEILTLAARQDLNIHARVGIDAILTDYVPTTLRTYAAAARAGHDGEDALREQLTSLHEAAQDILRAAQTNDINALEVQGVFLRSKFTGSDLDT